MLINRWLSFAVLTLGFGCSRSDAGSSHHEDFQNLRVPGVDTPANDIANTVADRKVDSEIPAIHSENHDVSSSIESTVEEHVVHVEPSKTVVDVSDAEFDRLEAEALDLMIRCKGCHTYGNKKPYFDLNISRVITQNLKKIIAKVEAEEMPPPGNEVYTLTEDQRALILKYTKILDLRTRAPRS